MFPISVTSNIKPAIVVTATIDANGFNNITKPKIKCKIELISIIDHVGEDTDFKLNEN